MTRTRLQVERVRQGRSAADVSRAAALGNTMYGWIEQRRYVPYPVQLERIAEALGWERDPSELL
ncbi:MAG: helix-turn-helix transcriptional regulator, partial [Actinomycetota bacterium]|nr:helix-turn-helix transcriptional regulator [Actinomycetota bacterium]